MDFPCLTFGELINFLAVGWGALANKISRQKTKQTQSVPNLTKKDGELTVSDEEKAEMLSQFFSCVFTHEETGNWNIPRKTDCEMCDMYFEDSKLWKELELLNTSKSPGFDEIHPVELKGA